MKIVPLKPKPSQKVSCLLNNQLCKIAVYQKTTGLYINLLVDDDPIITGRICRDRVRIVGQDYKGFLGDMFFMDFQGKDDPDYTGIGTRFFLCYTLPGEI